MREGYSSYFFCLSLIDLGDGLFFFPNGHRSMADDDLKDLNVVLLFLNQS